MPLSEIFDYFRSYDTASYEVYACQGNEPTDLDLAAFENEIGFALPDEFREFTMSPLGGLYMAVRESLWPRAKPFDVGPFWSFLYGLTVYGVAIDIPEILDIRIQYRRFHDEGESAVGLVPFLKIMTDPDPFCFTHEGHIVRWLHEEPERPEETRLTFSDLLMREIRALEDRKAKKLLQRRKRPL